MLSSLENALRNFATLTKGDVISINYNEKVLFFCYSYLSQTKKKIQSIVQLKDYELCILETRPGDAVSIIECDMDVDFAPPVGYQEPEPSFPNKPVSYLIKLNFHNEYHLYFFKIKTTSASSKNVLNKEKPQMKGTRLDGKASKISESSTDFEMKSAGNSGDVVRGQPDYNYKIGLLRLNQTIEKEEPEPV